MKSEIEHATAYAEDLSKLSEQLDELIRQIKESMRITPNAGFGMYDDEDANEFLRDLDEAAEFLTSAADRITNYKNK